MRSFTSFLIITVATVFIGFAPQSAEAKGHGNNRHNGGVVVIKGKHHKKHFRGRRHHRGKRYFKGHRYGKRHSYKRHHNKHGKKHFRNGKGSHKRHKHY